MLVYLLPETIGQIFKLVLFFSTLRAKCLSLGLTQIEQKLLCDFVYKCNFYCNFRCPEQKNTFYFVSMINLSVTISSHVAHSQKCKVSECAPLASVWYVKESKRAAVPQVPENVSAACGQNCVSRNNIERAVTIGMHIWYFTVVKNIGTVLQKCE